MSARSSLPHAALSVLVLLAGGCASPPSAAPVAQDPWESLNRKVFAFNEKVDAAVLAPVATAYVAAIPAPARQGVSNVFANLRDIWSVANHLLQGKGQESVTMSVRVLVNTSAGLGGLFDPATSLGLARQPEDFGQTLGRWGMPSGPYLVLPLLGPSSLRDGPAALVDRLAGPAALAGSDGAAYAVTALDAIDTRAGLLGATQMLDDLALDKYSLVRQVYTLRRHDAVTDGAFAHGLPNDAGEEAPALDNPTTNPKE